MSERGFWDDSLQALQQQYWERWSELSGKASATHSTQKSPWEMAQEHWWQAVSPAAPETAKEFMTRMMDQGRQLFRMAEQFAGSDGPEGDAPDWMDVLNRFSAGLSSTGGQEADPDSNERLHKMMGFWELPFDTWQRMASMLSILPPDLFRNMPHGGSESAADRLFSAPGLGYTREEQAQLQTLMRLIREYQRAVQEYSRFFSNIGRESVERLREKLRRNGAKGEVIDSARTLYDTWVASCEEVYSSHVMTPDYARINGQLVNASMGVKHQVGIMVDERLGSLNVPTRSELRTLQARMQDNRRENKRMRAELGKLKEEMAGLLATKSATGSATAGTRRKAAPRKKSSPKRLPYIPPRETPIR